VTKQRSGFKNRSSDLDIIIGDEGSFVVDLPAQAESMCRGISWYNSFREIIHENAFSRYVVPVGWAAQD
jgi:hypothetical protein